MAPQEGDGEGLGEAPGSQTELCQLLLIVTSGGIVGTTTTLGSAKPITQDMTRDPEEPA